MKTGLKKLLFGFLVLTACQPNGINDLESTIHTCPMVFSSQLPRFEENNPSKGGVMWKEGDVIFLVFQNGNKSVPGSAVYSLEHDAWTVTYEGNLAMEGKCVVRYFENTTTTTKNLVVCKEGTIPYKDAEATYVDVDGMVYLSAHLRPDCIRVRFRGEPKQSVKIKGCLYPLSYTTSTMNLIQEDSREYILMVDTVSENETYYTPYIYPQITEQTSLVLQNGPDYFVRDVNTRVLNLGKSVCMHIPTKTNYYNWNSYNDIAYNGHPFVDLGLSVVWADRNFGAETPSDLAHNGYATYTYPSSGELWGAPWRLPTKDEVEELQQKCLLQYSSLNTRSGVLIIGGNNSSIFIPKGSGNSSYWTKDWFQNTSSRYYVYNISTTSPYIAMSWSSVNNGWYIRLVADY